MCVLPSVLVYIESVNLKHALGSTFSLLQCVQRSVPRESFISAALII